MGRIWIEIEIQMGWGVSDADVSAEKDLRKTGVRLVMRDHATASEAMFLLLLTNMGNEPDPIS